ncbi:hypothetical protein FQR65_LT16021 [Abscondita terminalis]|nr:hypothetical protein FQR65_LT16021 [Abscondita terminalis]
MGNIHYFNAGIDFGFLGNRIYGSIDYFNKKDTDALIRADTGSPAPAGRIWTAVSVSANDPAINKFYSNSPNPTTLLGISTNVSYKKVSLAANSEWSDGTLSVQQYSCDNIRVKQQYKLRSTNKPLMVRKFLANAPLVFTREVTIRTSGATLETAGIRPMKYAFDYAVTGQRNNDWVYLSPIRDVLLMQAEAILRGGTGAPGDALALVNNALWIETCPRIVLGGLAQTGSASALEKLFTGLQEKAADADPKTLVYPIPSQQLAGQS